MNRSGIGSVVTDRRLNAAASWLVVGFLVVVVAESLLDTDLLWAAFVAVLVGVAAVPAVAYRDPRVTLPWEVLVLAALPVIGRSFATVPLTSDLATYLSVAAVALVVAVELHTFTTVRMSSGFAVLFVAVATMATAGVWAVARWLGDRWLDTAHLLDPELSEAAVHAGLMREFTYSTVAGIVAGIIFEGYFRRYARQAADAAVGTPGPDRDGPPVADDGGEADPAGDDAGRPAGGDGGDGEPRGSDDGRGRDESRSGTEPAESSEARSESPADVDPPGSADGGFDGGGRADANPPGSDGGRGENRSDVDSAGRDDGTVGDDDATGSEDADRADGDDAPASGGRS